MELSSIRFIGDHNRLNAEASIRNERVRTKEPAFRVNASRFSD
jgi:hypothetical protein